MTVNLENTAKNTPAELADGRISQNIGGWSRWCEFEKREFRKTLRKQGQETQTSRNFEASACWYNTRVKLSLISLIQLSGTDTSRNSPVFSRWDYGSFEFWANYPQKMWWRVSVSSSPSYAANCAKTIVPMAHQADTPKTRLIGFGDKCTLHSFEVPHDSRPFPCQGTTRVSLR